MMMNIIPLLPVDIQYAGTVEGQPIELPGWSARAFGFFLTVTDCRKDAADTLDVKVQHSPDRGDTWDDIVHFTQVLGNDADGLFKELAFLSTEISVEDEMRTPSTSLAAGNVMQGPIFPYLRAVATVTDPDDSGSFTFAVTMQVLQ